MDYLFFFGWVFVLGAVDVFWTTRVNRKLEALELEMKELKASITSRGEK